MRGVDIAIVAVQARKDMALWLRDQVDAEAIAWDLDGRGATTNHRQSWSYLRDADTEWVCVLEDDAVPIPDFQSQLPQVLDACPGDICSLYLGRGRPDHWQLPISAAITPVGGDPNFLRAQALLHMVGYAVRTRLLGKLYDFTTHPGPGRAQVELAERVGRWAVKNRLGIYYSRPSIIDHRDGPTVIPDEQREDGQSRVVAPHPSGTKARRAWVVDARESWNSSWAEIPKPDLRRRDKVSRHLRVVPESPERSPLCCPGGSSPAAD